MQEGMYMSHAGRLAYGRATQVSKETRLDHSRPDTKGQARCKGTGYARRAVKG